MDQKALIWDEREAYSWGEKALCKWFTQVGVSLRCHHGLGCRKFFLYSRHRNCREMRSPGFISELSASINCTSIHKYHILSYFKVALGKIKACYCFHPSVHTFILHFKAKFTICWMSRVRLTKQIIFVLQYWESHRDLSKQFWCPVDGTKNF